MGPVMSNAVDCAGCGAALAVPRGAAGKVLRCPRCAALNPIPAGREPDDEPGPPPRARRRERDPDDDPPPRRRTGGVPGWAWGVGAGVVGVAAVVVLGLTLGRRAQERDAQPVVPDQKELAEQGRLPETWERRTDEASGATWEFPHTGQTGPRTATVRFQDQSALTFSVTIKEVTAADKAKPIYHPLTRVRAAITGFGKDPSVEKVGTIDGRQAFVRRGERSVALITADWDREYEFTAYDPKRDEGEKRVKRFLDSVRITKPPPPEPSPAGPGGGTPVGPKAVADSGEVIPAGWDRVQLPKTTLTLLMPKDPAPEWARKSRIPGGTSVNRAMVTPAGEEVVVSATYFEATQVGPAIADPFGGVSQEKAMTVGGHPARLSIREFGGMSYVSLVIQPTPLKFIYIGVGGQAKIDETSPEAKRVIDSLSFTLPPKAGPEGPVDYNPAWTRRFAPGGTFSVEIPGPTGPASEAGVAMAGGVSWVTKGRLPLPDDKFGLHFTASALGGLGAVPDPRKTIEQEIEYLPKTKGAPQFVRRVEVAGRPGYVAAKTADGGMGSVRLKLQDKTMTYQLDAVGRWLTPDSPPVKRFLDSIRFDLTRPAGAAPGVLEVPAPKGP